MPYMNESCHTRVRDVVHPYPRAHALPYMRHAYVNATERVTARTALYIRKTALYILQKSHGYQDTFMHEASCHI